MHRTRLMLPYLRDLGWEPTVLAIDPAYIEGGVHEPLLEKTYPSDIRIVRVRGIPPGATRWAGVGSLWLRCGRAYRRAGEKLLEAEAFDLVFFSTTQFEAFQLGPEWKRRFRVPYVLDYQDPWVNAYYGRTRTRPPGGRIKFAFSQWRARRIEPEALRGAAGIVAVSDAYGPMLAREYGWFDASAVRFIPFGASENDLETAAAHQPRESLVPSGDGLFHHVYAGRCGPDMSTSLTILFRAFKRFLAARPDDAAKTRFHFVGTDYAPRPLGREWAMPVAIKENVEAYVTEHCYRVPYFDALHYLARADALLAVGSNDPTYSASKIYPFVLARRPLMILFNELSPVVSIANRLRCGSRYTFRNANDIEGVAKLVADDWFLAGRMREVVDVDPVEFLPYTAKGMTQQLVRLFDASAKPPTSTP